MADDLQWHRTALCDLLIGRSFRLVAAELLELALTAEKWGLPNEAAEGLAQAAHIEWTAGITERGTVLYGSRHNRCGYQPEFE